MVMWFTFDDQSEVRPIRAGIGALPVPRLASIFLRVEPDAIDHLTEDVEIPEAHRAGLGLAKVVRTFRERHHEPPFHEAVASRTPDARAPQPTPIGRQSVKHNTIVYQYLPCTRWHYIVPSALYTFSDTVSTNQSWYRSPTGRCPGAAAGAL